MNRLLEKKLLTKKIDSALIVDVLWKLSARAAEHNRSGSVGREVGMAYSSAYDMLLAAAKDDAETLNNYSPAKPEPCDEPNGTDFEVYGKDC